MENVLYKAVCVPNDELTIACFSGPNGKRVDGVCVSFGTEVNVYEVAKDNYNDESKWVRISKKSEPVQCWYYSTFFMKTEDYKAMKAKEAERESIIKSWQEDRSLLKSSNWVPSDPMGKMSCVKANKVVSRYFDSKWNVKEDWVRTSVEFVETLPTIIPKPDTRNIFKDEYVVVPVTLYYNADDGKFYYDKAPVTLKGMTEHECRVLHYAFYKLTVEEIDALGLKDKYKYVCDEMKLCGYGYNYDTRQ